MILLHGFLIIQHVCELILFDLIYDSWVHLPFPPNGFLRNQTHILACKEAFFLAWEDETRMKLLTWTHSLKALNSASHMPLDTSVYDLLIHLPYATDWFAPPHIDYISHCLLHGKVETGVKLEGTRKPRAYLCSTRFRGIGECFQWLLVLEPGRHS